MKKITVELDSKFVGWMPDGEPMLKTFYVCEKCYPKVVFIVDITREEEIKEGWRHICHICTERELENATQK